jgi:hypothetical protein
MLGSGGRFGDAPLRSLLRPDALQCRNGSLAQSVWITLAYFRYLDDLAGDKFGYRIIPVGKLKHFERMLVSRRHPLDGLRLEQTLMR